MLTMIGACHVTDRRVCISSAAIECRLDSKHDLNHSIHASVAAPTLHPLGFCPPWRPRCDCPLDPS